MNEWPTRVRSGTPPCSRMISGTAREVIRLWMIVAPGYLASSRVATSAVIALGDTAPPLRVDDEAPVGVAVEREADVGALQGDDRRLQVTEVRRLERVRLVVREGPVQLEVQRHDRQRQRVEHRVTEHGRHG